LRGLRNSLGYFSHVKHFTIDIDIDIEKGMRREYRPHGYSYKSAPVATLVTIIAATVANVVYVCLTCVMTACGRR